MKRILSIAFALLFLAVLTTGGYAEESSALDAFTSRLQKTGDVQTGDVAMEIPADDNSYGRPVLIDDPFYQKVRSSAYLQKGSYSDSANVMIELKNVSGRTLYPGTVTTRAMSKSGEVLDEEKYSSCGPAVVENGESLFIWDWFVSLETEIDLIDYFEVTLESDTSSHTQYAQIQAQAAVIEGTAYALVENTKEDDIYGVDATIVIEDGKGRLLDVCSVNTYDSCGVFPGSIMVLRADAKDYESGGKLMDGKATAYTLYELD